jgi:hypothetical protein
VQRNNEWPEKPLDLKSVISVRATYSKLTLSANVDRVQEQEQRQRAHPRLDVDRNRSTHQGPRVEAIGLSPPLARSSATPRNRGESINSSSFRTSKARLTLARGTEGTDAMLACAALGGGGGGGRGGGGGNLSTLGDKQIKKR